MYLASPTALQKQDKLWNYNLLYNFQKHYFHRKWCPAQQFKKKQNVYTIMNIRRETNTNYDVYYFRTGVNLNPDKHQPRL